jgi:hypothetical protein
MYGAALADINLGTDPWSTNRYSFTGGNPISNVDLTGHMVDFKVADAGGCGSCNDDWASRVADANTPPASQDDGGGGFWSHVGSAASATGSFVGHTAVDMATSPVRLGDHMGKEMYGFGVEVHGAVTNNPEEVNRGWQMVHDNAGAALKADLDFAGAVTLVGGGATKLLQAGVEESPGVVSRVAAAFSGKSLGERLFTSKWLGADSKMLGNSFMRGAEGLLNKKGAMVKFGWSTNAAKGGYALRLGLGRSATNASQAGTHLFVPFTRVPFDVGNPLAVAMRKLNGLP